MSDPVKGRTEAGRRREQRAHRTRARIVEAALRLFVSRGYRATSVVEIAREAGVAPATIYQAFGTKQAVLARALDTAIAGDASFVALLDRGWVDKARRNPRARDRLEEVVRRAAEVAVRTAPLKEVMRDAAADDPQVRELIRQDHERRRHTQRELVEIALGSEPLRPGLTVDRAAETFSMLVSSDGYDLARGTFGWTEGDWQEWLVDVLTQDFFGSAAR